MSHKRGQHEVVVQLELFIRGERAHKARQEGWQDVLGEGEGGQARGEKGEGSCLGCQVRRGVFEVVQDAEKEGQKGFKRRLIEQDIWFLEQVT